MRASFARIGKGSATWVIVAATSAVLVWLSAAWVEARGETTQSPPPQATASPSADQAASPHHALLSRYCFTCHNQRLKTAGLALDTLDVTKVGVDSAVWEKVVWKLRGGIMPPIGRPRPGRHEIDQLATWLEGELDGAAAARLNPGRVPAHRLNRAEYVNVVRDILGVQVEPTLLPADEVGHGFDSIAGNLTLSPALLERYLAVARRVSRLAVGDPSIGPGYTSRTYVVPINMTQNDRMNEDLPLGSRAGLASPHLFPLDGDYQLRIRLKKSVYEYIVNLEEPHDLDVRLDGERIARYTIGGVSPGKPAPVSFSGTFMAAGGAGYPTQEWDEYRTSADAHLNVDRKSVV